MVLRALVLVACLSSDLVQVWRRLAHPPISSSFAGRAFVDAQCVAQAESLTQRDYLRDRYHRLDVPSLARRRLLEGSSTPVAGIPPADRCPGINSSAYSLVGASSLSHLLLTEIAARCPCALGSAAASHSLCCACSASWQARCRASRNPFHSLAGGVGSADLPISICRPSCTQLLFERWQRSWSIPAVHPGLL